MLDLSYLNNNYRGENMKVYYVEVSGGSYEDYYCYNDSAYISKERAENRKFELDKELARLIKLGEIASNCDGNSVTDEECEKCMVCKNSFFKVWDNERYAIKEIEVVD